MPCEPHAFDLPFHPRTPAQVAFVGAGPGDPGLLTVRASELLATADAVVIDQVARHDVVERWCAPGIPVVDAGHGDHGENLTHASRAKLVVRAAKRRTRAASSCASWTVTPRSSAGSPRRPPPA